MVADIWEDHNVNNHLPDEDANNTDTTNNRAANTGDASDIYTWIELLMGAAVIMVLMRKRREE